MKLNKKQKRTATIASMAALLAVVLGMGGQTFAKYVSTQSVDAQTATVAKWGLNATVDTSKFFGEKYDNTNKVTTGDSGISVQGAKEVVAPGTEGTMTVTFGGDAEVDATIGVKVNVPADKSVDEVLVLPSLKYNTSTYYPIEWTVGDTTAKTPTELKTALEGLQARYEAEGSFSVSTFTVSWRWAYYVDDATDTLDTILATNSNGTVKIGNVDYTVNTSLSVAFDVVFTQAD